MASVQEIRQRLRGQRIEALRSSIEPLLAGRAACKPGCVRPTATSQGMGRWPWRPRRV